MHRRFSEFVNRSFGREHSQKRNKKHGSVLRHATFARRLRCEPLEDRRMLAILMVDADAASGGDGLTWGSAYNDLQLALGQAATLNTDGDTGNNVDAVWIAEGTYKPSALLESGDARSASFSLLDGVTLYGGFAGSETTLEERDWSTHITTLSGDLGTPDDNSDNAYTVVYCGDNIEARIDGVSITGGNSNGSLDSSHPGKHTGGGIYISGTLTVTNCTLSGNLAMGGGGIHNETGTLMVTNSTLVGNSASGTGGGGISNYYGTLTVTNCTLSGNSNGDGYSGGILNHRGTLTVNNSIVYLNSEYNIQSFFDGSNNLINIDPCFVRKPSAGVDGEWGTDDDDLGDLRLTDRSPAINAGSNILAVDMADNPLTTDLSGNLRIVDGKIDIGAYEYQGAPASGRETPSLVVSAPDDEFDLYDGEITIREALYYSESEIDYGTVFVRYRPFSPLHVVVIRVVNSVFLRASPVLV